MKASLLLLLVAVAALALSAARPAPGVLACGPAGPFDFDAYEAENYVTVYAQAIELAAAGAAITSTFTVGERGEIVDLRYQGLERGPRTARTSTLDTSLRIPPTLFKSIAWIESNYTQASNAVPFGGVGPALRSFDCGYGLGQITTGMANTSGTPSAKQALIGTHYLFNIAEGIRILADKWNSAPGLRPIAGTGDPAILEDWYFAVWSYNGFAFSNHPLNPMRNPLRGGAIPETAIPEPTATPSPTEPGEPDPSATPSPTVSNPIHDAGVLSPAYHCYDREAPSYQARSNGEPMFGYGDYTYPERVYGCIRHPPKRAPVGSPPGTPATIQFWSPIPVNMPDFSRPEVSQAFDPAHFLACEESNFAGGCAAMDFPTSFPPALTTHVDPTPYPPGSALAAALGFPALVVDGPREALLNESATGVTSVAITVRNTGTWIGPFRVRTSAPWIVVRKPGDAASRTLDGGVAIGTDTEVVTQQASAGPPPRPRIAQRGYSPQIIITANPSLLGASQDPRGTVWIEPLLGGPPIAIEVRLEGHVGVDLPNRLFLPWVSSEPAD